MNLFKLFSGSGTKNTKPANSSDQAPGLLARALEPRIMFDGAGAVTAEALAEPTENVEAAPPPADNDAALIEALSQVAAAPAEETRTEVLFIGASVKDYQDLLVGMDADIEVHILTEGEDGLSTMAQILEGRSDIDAIHVISHGGTGRLILGNSTLTIDTINANAETLTSIGQSLSADGDLLLYGCNIGQDGAGQAFIDALGAITEADIAASDDLTGAASLDGDWNLEASSGTVGLGL